MAADPEGTPPAVDEGRPPFFKTWGGAYAFVLASLAVTIAVFAVITWVYA